MELKSKTHYGIRIAMTLNGDCFCCVSRFLKWKNTSDVSGKQKPAISKGDTIHITNSLPICFMCAKSRKKNIQPDEKQKTENVIKQKIKQLKGIEKIRYIKEQFGSKK